MQRLRIERTEPFLEKLLSIFRENVDSDKWNRATSALDIRSAGKFNLNSYNGIRDLLDEVQHRSKDVDVYKQILVSYLNWFSKVNISLDQSPTKSKSKILTSSKAPHDVCDGSGLSVAKVTSVSGIDHVSGKTLATKNCKVVNITNNFYCNHKKSDSSDSCEDETVKSFKNMSIKTSSRKRRGARAILLKRPLCGTIDPIDDVIFPHICTTRGCRWCSECLMLVPKCDNRECPLGEQHIAARHVPNLNSADRRKLRRVHGIENDSSSCISGNTMQPIEKCSAFLNSLAVVPETLEGVPKGNDPLAVTASRRSKRVWSQSVESENDSADVDGDKHSIKSLRFD